MGLPAAGLARSIVPNAGLPQRLEGQFVYAAEPQYFGDAVRRFLDAGARIIGGCCGTTFEHLAAMRDALQTHHAGARPDDAKVVAILGALQAPGAKGGHKVGGEGRRNRRT